MLKLNNVQKDYDLFSLKCSMTIVNGQISGLIGKNGAGKSTTFKAILDLISIDGGTIEIFDKDHKELTNLDKQKIGVVLSHTGFSEYLNIIDISAILEKFYNDFSKEHFINQCQQQGLPLNKKINTFSTGMKAKLKILIALSHHVELLILDEPTAGLDVLARDELLDLLRDYMSQNENCSILMSSHISSDLESICDDIYMIDQGKIVLHEDTDVLLSDYAILKVSEEQYQTLDKKYILKYMKETYGYSCLTKEKQFYVDNYKDIVIENSNIDKVMMIMIRGEQAC